MRYLAQNFSPAVALPRGGVGDNPGHLRGPAAVIRPLSARLAGPRLTHAAAVVGLWGPAVSPYFHEVVFLLQSRTPECSPKSPSPSLYTLASSPPLLSAALCLTSQYEMRAWGLLSIDYPASTWVLLTAQTWNQRGLDSGFYGFR